MDEAKLRSLLDEAAERYNDGDYDRAIALWRAVLELDADNQKAREGIRMASLLAADWEQPGSGESESVSVQDAESRERVEAGIARVKELAENGQYAEALEGCELLSEIAPGLEEVRQLTEQVRLAAGTTGSVPARGAGADLQSLLKSARKALEQGQNKEAARAARAALQIDPSNMEACGILSLAADEADAAEPVRIGESQPGAAAAATGRPANRVSALIEEGQAAFDQNNFQGAIAIWSRIFAIDQTNSTAGALIDRARSAIDDQARQLDDVFYRGVDAKDAGRVQEALGLFEEVLAASPSHAEAKAQIAEIEARLRPSSQTIPIDSAAARDVAEEKNRASKARGEPQLFTGSIPLAIPKPGPSPRGSAPQREPMPAASHRAAAPSRGSRRVMAVLGLMVVLGAAAGAYLWLGRENGTMSEALAREAAPPRLPVPQPPPAETAPAQPPGPLQVLPGAHPTTTAAPPASVAQPTGSAADMEREGRIHFEAGRWAAAALALRKSFELDPLKFSSQDLLDTAMSHLEKQAHLESEMGQANQYFKEEDYASALHKFYRLQQDYPEMAGVTTYIKNSWYNWGILLLQSGAVDEAVEKLDEVLEIDPADRDAAKAREVAKKYHGRKRDTVFDSFCAALTPRAIDQR